LDSLSLGSNVCGLLPGAPLFGHLGTALETALAMKGRLLDPTLKMRY